MPAYNFQQQFADAVQSGEKRQTIRAIGKRRHATPGQPIQLYTGMMHKTCRKLIKPDPVCTAVQRIRIEKFAGKNGEADYFAMYLDGEVMFKHEVRDLAINDGFDSPEAFFQFFDQTYFKKNGDWPFSGLLIRW